MDLDEETVRRIIREELAKRPAILHIRRGPIGILGHRLAYDAETQYKVHLYGAIFWLANFPVVLWLFLFLPDLWLRISELLILLYSIYALLATDYGAMSAARAAAGEPPLPEIPLEDNDP